jgi:hypothetical protein
VARFIASYYSIRSNETHDELQKKSHGRMVEITWTIIVPASNLHICFIV